MFLREVVTGKKTGNPVRYAQIVESYRNEQGKSRHRVLLSLGRVDRINTDQIRRLIMSLSRYLETGTIPEGGHIGEVRDFGVAYIAEKLWSRYDLGRFFKKELKKRKYKAPVERALFALVAHRMADPGSKLACSEWLDQDVYLPDTRTVELQHLYRAMDFLDDCHEELERALYSHRRTLFDQVRLVYYDTTSTYFEFDEPSDEPLLYGLRQRGYSRDKRPDRKQIVVGLAVDQQGLPIVSEVFSGDTNDSLTVVPMLERLSAMGLRDVMWVTDRGMVSDANLASVRAAGLNYVIGVRLRSAEDLRKTILSDDEPYEPADDGLMVKEVWTDEKRYVVCFSPSSAERDLKLRTGAIERMRPVLERVNAGGDPAMLTSHGLYKRFVRRHKDGTYHLDKNKLEKEAQCDGTFVLEVSDEEMSAEDAALAYKGLMRVEQAFRTLKHGVDIRPVYHRLDKRIRAHVTLCMIAYLLERIVELDTKLTFDNVRRVLRRMRAVELTFDGQTVWESSKPSKFVRKVLDGLYLPVPPRVLPPLT